MKLNLSVPRQKNETAQREEKAMSISSLIVKEIVSIYTVDLRNTEYSRAGRPYCGLCMKLSGSSVYFENGHTYHSDASHLIFIPQGATYTYRIKEMGDCVIVDFTAENAPDTIQSLPIHDSHVLKSLAVNMQYAWNFKRMGYREICLSSMYQILYHAILHENDAYVSNIYQARIEESIRYLNDHFCDRTLSIKNLSEQSGISEIYFRKQFTQIYGMSPKKYILLMRINYAKELLDINELSIRQISEDVGFGDIYSFSKTFRREVGCTPSEYKRKLFAK